MNQIFHFVSIFQIHDQLTHQENLLSTVICKVEHTILSSSAAATQSLNVDTLYNTAKAAYSPKMNKHKTSIIRIFKLRELILSKFQNKSAIGQRIPHVLDIQLIELNI